MHESPRLEPVISKPSGRYPDLYQILTLAGIIFMVVSTVLFGLNVGVSAICVSAILMLISPSRHSKIVDDISWPAVVLVCGMVTYMAVLTQNGTLEMLGDAASRLGSPLLTALILCFAVGLISAFGSSMATLGIALPLAAPLLDAGELGAFGLVVALAFSATVVDVSPFSANGAIVIANADVADRTRFQRKMLGYCAITVAAAPLLAWLLLVVPFSA